MPRLLRLTVLLALGALLWTACGGGTEKAASAPSGAGGSDTNANNGVYGAVCAEDGDCATGEKCVDPNQLAGMVQGCFAPEANGQLCATYTVTGPQLAWTAGYCARPCAADAECASASFEGSCDLGISGSSVVIGLEPGAGDWCFIRCGDGRPACPAPLDCSVSWRCGEQPEGSESGYCLPCDDELGQGGTAGSSGGTSSTCAGGNACDDGDGCTVDSCASGECRHTPISCANGDTCCDGDCVECCGDGDCDDGIACTLDQCAGIACVHLESDLDCPIGQICSAMGCVVDVCAPSTEESDCDDSNPCTTDTCENGVCTSASCQEPAKCCPDVGCGICCDDEECETGDPCSVPICLNGTCEEEPLCEGLCCPSSDGLTASCGIECCSEADCPDDGIACTAALCSDLGCSVFPDSNLCGVDQVCDPSSGCVP